MNNILSNTYWKIEKYSIFYIHINQFKNCLKKRYYNKNICCNENFDWQRFFDFHWWKNSMIYIWITMTTNLKLFIVVNKPEKVLKILSFFDLAKIWFCISSLFKEYIWISILWRSCLFLVFQFLFFNHSVYITSSWLYFGIFYLFLFNWYRIYFT